MLCSFELQFFFCGDYKDSHDSLLIDSGLKKSPEDNQNYKE